MNPWTATVGHELRSAGRERLPQLLLVIFIGMTASAAFIGSAAKATVTEVYNSAAGQGLTSAPNPFGNVPPLYYARNTVIYILLSGALLAIVTGVQSAMRDRRARTVDLVLTRRLSPAGYLSAKMTGISLGLLAVLGSSALISAACISAVTGTIPAFDQLLRLLALFGVAWLFLLFFVALGMLSGIHASSYTSALLVPIVIWSVIIFVLPLLGSAVHPVSLLNPVTPPTAPQTGVFAVTESLTGPFSLGEHFKHVAAILLQDPQATGTMAGGITVIVAFLSAGIGAVSLTGRSSMRKEIHD
ncbi:ABC transporter permease [Pseudarthrobacter sp. PH31-O2]|uniref:ABC transporter permease n=1 Tax=Pseudarthrobacter sp. PH31-O2 TaxID=3046206 RepID=UPI0024BA2F82|nr:ABC transporter permease [Pseudarthrobacter sp. PH31-O2]MDJ0354318.1 ABC transporter permease [Pseudarthrobacter sp. PH31-O2]